MKLIGYIRVSSESQAENTSQDEQERRIRAYCEAFEIELVKVFREVGSGKTAKGRPVFQEALEAVANEADGIIALKLDRIARNCRDVLTLVEDVLQPNNKALVLLDLNVDTSTPTGKMILTVMAATAELERSQINERTQGGRKAKAASGGYAYGSPKYGQKSTEQKELVEDEKEQQVIELIRKHRRSGKSYRAIAMWLNENDYKSKQGKQWRHTSVKKILDRLKVK